MCFIRLFPLSFFGRFSSQLLLPFPSSPRVPNDGFSCMNFRWFDSVHFDCVTGIFKTGTVFKAHVYGFFILTLFFFYVVSLLTKPDNEVVWDLPKSLHSLRTSYAYFSPSPTLAIHDDDLTFVWCFGHSFFGLFFFPVSSFLLVRLKTPKPKRDPKMRRDFHI